MPEKIDQNYIKQYLALKKRHKKEIAALKIKHIKYSEHEDLKDDKGNPVYGLAWKDIHTIAIEKKLTPFSKLGVQIHECLHLMFPYMSEKEVLKNEDILAHYLWQLGYRANLKNKKKKGSIKIYYLNSLDKGK